MGETCSLHARKLLSQKGKMDMLVKPKVIQNILRLYKTVNWTKGWKEKL